MATGDGGNGGLLNPEETQSVKSWLISIHDEGNIPRLACEVFFFLFVSSTYSLFAIVFDGLSIYYHRKEVIWKMFQKFLYLTVFLVRQLMAMFMTSLLKHY